MESLGNIMRELTKRMQQREIKTFSSDEDLSQYECIICKDQERLFFRVHRDAKIGEDGVPDNMIPEDDFFGGKVDPMEAHLWIDKWSKECSCRSRKLKRKKMEQLMDQAGISKKFRKRTFDNVVWLDPNIFPADYRQDVINLMDQQRKAYDMILQYCINFDDLKEDGAGVGIFGTVGTGKTHLLAAKANYLLDRGVQSVWVNTNELFSKIRSTFDKDASGKPVKTVRASEIITLLKECEDLTFDDLGKESEKDWVLDIIYEIVNHRYENELPMSFSTNCLTTKELEERLGSAIYRRIVEPAMGRIAKIEGWSFDQLKVKRRRDL